MSKFNVGDKVRVVNGHGIWLETAGSSYPDSTILTVVDDDCATLEDSEIFIGILEQWPDDFELVFSITQEETVRCDPPEVIIPITRDKSDVFAGYRESLQTAHESQEPSLLGVYRPKLEDRKVGKVQMHMVDDGFPNALRHIAEIMTWAEKTKGYKLHDWANLPNADIEFPSAEYRHKNDNSIQKSQGLSALERVDHESGKLHVGHKIFNALCELELILRGVIK